LAAIVVAFAAPAAAGACRLLEGRASPPPAATAGPYAAAAAGAPPVTAAPLSAPAPAPAPSGAAPVVPPERLPEVPASLAGRLDVESRRRLAIAASVCPAVVFPEEDRLRVGCRSCPPFTADNGPDGLIVVGPRDGDGFYELEASYAGAFSRPGADEVAAVFAGCEPAAENFGGTLLVVRHHDDVWAAQSYRSGFHPEACVVFQRPDAAALLVCRWRTAHQLVGHEYLDTYDFTRGSEQDVQGGWERVLGLTTDAPGACLDGRGADGPPVVAGRLDAFRIHAATPAHPAELAVDAHAIRSPRTPALMARCRALTAELARAEPRPIDVVSALRPPALRLVFPWNGRTFAATPDTERAIAAVAPPEDDPG